MALFVDQFVRLFYWEHYLRRRRQRPAPALIRDLVTVALLIIGLSVGLSVEEGMSVTGLITASGATALVLGIALQRPSRTFQRIVGSPRRVLRARRLADRLHRPDAGAAIWKSDRHHLAHDLSRAGRRPEPHGPKSCDDGQSVLNHSRPVAPKRCGSISLSTIACPPTMWSTCCWARPSSAAEQGLARKPDPDVIISKIDAVATTYRVRFYFWPEQTSPSNAQSAVFSAALTYSRRMQSPARDAGGDGPPPDLAFPLGDERKRAALERAPLFAHALDSAQLDQLGNHARSSSCRAAPC